MKLLIVENDKEADSTACSAAVRRPAAGWVRPWLRLSQNCMAQR
jgi:hypothetical protein